MDIYTVKIEPGDTIFLKVSENDNINEIITFYNQLLDHFPDNKVFFDLAENNIEVLKGEM